MSAASTGNISKSYVSTLDSLLDTREINKQIADVQNEVELSDILGLGGKKMPTMQPIYYSFYDDPLIKAVTVTTNTGDGTVSVTPALTAATSGYARQGDVVLFSNNLSGLITNVSSSSGIDTLTIKSVSGANLTLGATDTLSLYSRARGENSYGGSNVRYGLTRLTNKYQIFDELSVITDVQNASTVEVEFQGKPYWFFKDQWEKTVKMKSDINAAFIAGDMSVTSFSDTNAFLTDTISSPTNYFPTSGNGNVQTTRGLNRYTDLYGVALVNGSLGTYQKANLDEYVAAALAVRSWKKVLAVSGTLAKTTVDTYFKALGSSGVQSVRLVVGGRELDMEVDQIKYGGFTLNYATMPMFDHPVTLASGTITKNIYYLPLDNKIKVEGGGSEDQMRIRYVPKQTVYGNDMVNEIHGGALSPINPNGDGMCISTRWVTAQGVEMLAPTQLIKQRVI
jgi:hypothetical protein